MPLIDLQTNLRDLKYGNDRPNGNSSNQPYFSKSFVQSGNTSLDLPNIGGGNVALPTTNLNIPGIQFNTQNISVGNFNIVDSSTIPNAGAIAAPFIGGVIGGLIGASVGAGGAGFLIGAGLGAAGVLSNINTPNSTTTLGGNFNLPSGGGGNVTLPIGVGSQPDFLVRGGILGAPAYGLQDAARLVSYFLDIKSPSGLFFSLKQNILSKASVRTEASANIFNDSLYLPTSTIAQAGAVGLGIHLNKQGLNPLRNRDSYRQAVQYDQYQDVEGRGYNALTEHNRLVALHRLKIIKDPNYDSVVKINGITIDRDDNNHLLEYGGGPGAILGIGKTKIKLHCGGTRNRIANPLDTDRSSIVFEVANLKKKKRFWTDPDYQIPSID